MAVNFHQKFVFLLSYRCQYIQYKPFFFSSICIVVSSESTMHLIFHIFFSLWSNSFDFKQNFVAIFRISNFRIATIFILICHYFHIPYNENCYFILLLSLSIPMLFSSYFKLYFIPFAHGCSSFRFVLFWFFHHFIKVAHCCVRIKRVKEAA